VTGRRERAGFGFADQRPHERSTGDVTSPFIARINAGPTRRPHHSHTRHDRKRIRKAENRMGDASMTNGPRTRGSSFGEKRRSGIVRGRLPRTARRGWITLKGTKPHERRSVTSAFACVTAATKSSRGARSVTPNRRRAARTAERADRRLIDSASGIATRFEHAEAQGHLRR
jgi:hypothetical protein